MAKGMTALNALFAASTSVTCQSCGVELKGGNIPRLARRGCPQCASKQFSFHGLPEGLAARFQGVQHVA